MIFASEVSGISGAASKFERFFLFDVANDVLELSSIKLASSFGSLAPTERKWFVAELRYTFFVYLRNALVSRNAPGGWERLTATISRTSQSMCTLMTRASLSGSRSIDEIESW